MANKRRSSKSSRRSDGPRRAQPARGTGILRQARKLRAERLEPRYLLAASVAPATLDFAAQQDHDIAIEHAQEDHEHAEHGAAEHGAAEHDAAEHIDDDAHNQDDHHDEDHHHYHPPVVSPFPELLPAGGPIVTVRQALSNQSAEATGPNLSITRIQLVDTDFNEVTSPIQGQQIRMQVFWDTFELPSDTQYTIHFSMDGKTIDNGIISLGQGQNQANWFWWRSGFYAVGTSHTLTVTLDGTDTVTESDETDNSLDLTFSTDSTTLPPSLIFPVEEKEDRLVDWVNYLDVDATSAFEDYTGGNYSYNGHRGWDLSIAGFGNQDDGFEVFATAAGTVLSTNDGEFDRETLGFNQDPLPDANFVIVDHGGGWHTWYWHLRRDSVRVEVGDVVGQGDVLGFVGSSGVSSGAHLHFEIRHRGLPIESAINAASYFADPRDYVHGRRQVYETGLTNYWPFNDTAERASQLTHWRSDSRQFIHAYLRVAGIVQGDQLQVRYVRPDGSTLSNWNFTFPQSRAFSNWFNRRTLPLNPALGEWKVEYRINNSLVSTESLIVSDVGVSEIRVTDPDDEIVLDNRVTPIDFGETQLGQSPMSMTFMIHNQGHETLNVSQVTAPEGFSVAGVVPSSVLPGGSAPLTIQLDTNLSGLFNGQVRIENNDPNESEMNFTVEGLVRNPTLSQQILLGFDRRRGFENETILGKVRRVESPVDTSAPLVIQLSSADPAGVSVPASVTIPEGQEELLFDVLLGAGSTNETHQSISVTATSVLAGNAVASLDVTTTPKIESIVVNGGDVQRSILDNIEITFDRVVEIDDGTSSAFSVTDWNQNPVAANWFQTVSNGMTTVTLSLPPDLKDANYRLAIDGDKISAGTQLLDGDQNGVAGGTSLFGGVAADRFFRFFGDTDGDRDVDGQDYGRFGLTFLKSQGHPDFNAALDSDRDGDVDGQDYGRFGLRFLNRLSAP